MPWQGRKPPMPLELGAVALDGAFTAERELNNLRVSRLDPWVGEVAVLEHYHGSVHATRATSPDYGGTGYAGLPAGGFIFGLLAGPVPHPQSAGGVWRAPPPAQGHAPRPHPGPYAHRPEAGRTKGLVRR